MAAPKSWISGRPNGIDFIFGLSGNATLDLAVEITADVAARDARSVTDTTCVTVPEWLEGV
jgi:hypothetical protein